MKLSPNTRILMTTDTIGGVWTYAAGLASSLSNSGINVCLLTMGPKPRADQREMLSDSVQLIESDLALEWQDPEGSDISRARDFLDTVAQRIKPDIIHLNSYREACFGWQSPVVVVAHSCVVSWARACNDRSFLSEPRWQKYAELVARGLEQADAWVAPTRAYRDIVRETYQPSHSGSIIRNGAILRRVRTENKNRFILAAGRMWDSAKNLAVLANAGRDLDWPTFVAGTADPSAGSLATGVELTGELSHAELDARMQRAAIFVSPARYEPFGLSVLEAAGAGCALILSDIASLRELWDGAALFVAPDDVDAWRETLATLCEAPDERLRLQRAAFGRAKRYSLKRMADSYIRLYRALLSPRFSRERNIAEVRA